MYIGHIGAALAAKRARPRMALAVLLLATYALDWIDAAICLAGSPRPMLSHSIPAVAGFALAGGALYGLRWRDWVGALMVGAVIASHVVLDYLTGYKPTWPGGPYVGLRLYGNPLADFLLEGAVIGAGVVLYARTLPPQRRVPDAALMAGALLAMQLAIDVGHAIMRSTQKC